MVESWWNHGEICTVDYIDVFVIVYDSSDFTRFISILLYASLYHYVVTCDYIYCKYIVTALYVFDSIFAESFDDVCFHDFCDPSSAFQHQV